MNSFDRFSSRSLINHSSLLQRKQNVTIYIFCPISHHACILLNQQLLWNMCVRGSRQGWWKSLLLNQELWIVISLWEAADILHLCKMGKTERYGEQQAYCVCYEKKNHKGLSERNLLTSRTTISNSNRTENRLKKIVCGNKKKKKKEKREG